MEHAFGGALAQNYWGTVRATQDIDVLVAIPRVEFQRVADALNAAGFRMRDTGGGFRPVSVEAIVAEERARRLFTVYWALIKVEVFVPFLPLQHSILRRAMPQPFQDCQISVTSPEDLILLKMVFHRPKDLRDIRGILWNQQHKLDMSYMREWARKMLSSERVEELDALVANYLRASS